MSFGRSVVSVAYSLELNVLALTGLAVEPSRHPKFVLELLDHCCTRAVTSNATHPGVNGTETTASALLP